jgi:hypothetical protein
MHFNHTWAFMEQDSKTVDGKPLVAGINSFDDILVALAECTLLGNPKQLRLTKDQVLELDHFTSKHGGEDISGKTKTPFMDYLKPKHMLFSDECS